MIIIAILGFLIVSTWVGSRVATAQERIADTSESAASNRRFEQIDVKKYHSGEFSGIEPSYFDTRSGETKK